MKFTANNTLLLGKIQMAASVINAKNVVPVLGGILLEVAGEKLFVSATNGAQSVSICLDSEAFTALRSGRCAVPGKKLLALLSALPQDEELTFECINDHVKLSGANCEFTLFSYSADDFPLVIPADIPQVLTTNAGEINQLISDCASAICKDDGRPALTGLLLDIASGITTGCATDGKRLSVVTNNNTSSTETKKLIIPNSFFALMSKLGGEEIQVFADDKNIVLKNEKVIIASKLISGNYPNYRSVIPQSFRYSCKLETLELTKAVKQMTVIADSSQTIRLDFAENTLKISADKESVGTGVIKLPCDGGGEISVCINPRFLLDALANCGEEVSIKLNDGYFPMLIERSSDSYTILMPIRAK